MYLGINGDRVTSQAIESGSGLLLARNDRAVVVRWPKVWISGGARAGFGRSARTSVYRIIGRVKSRTSTEVLRVEPELIGFNHTKEGTT